MDFIYLSWYLMSERSYSYSIYSLSKFGIFEVFFLGTGMSFLRSSESFLVVVIVDRAFFREGSFETLWVNVS